MERVHLGTVTPVYRGAAWLRDLVAALAQIRQQLDAAGEPLALTEAIFVDDGAVDSSATVLAELAREHPWLRVITLSRNYGQHPATVAGILHSSADWVATLDEDLQHDPQHLVPLVLHAVDHGHDLVYAAPTAPVHEAVFRDASSRVYKALLARLSGNPNVRRFNSYRMIRGSIARAAAAVAAHETYLDIALGWFTDRVGGLALPLKDQRHIDRTASGYTVSSLLAHARRLLVSSDVRSLRLGVALGLASVGISVVMTVITLLTRIYDPHAIIMRGWASTMLAVVFFGGLTCLISSLVLDYVVGLVHHAQGRPTFFVVNRQRDELLLPMVERHRARLAAAVAPAPPEPGP
jgi:glycosyltransferase involved in cell wall biosynthesis